MSASINKAILWYITLLLLIIVLPIPVYLIIIMLVVSFISIIAVSILTVIKKVDVNLTIPFIVLLLKSITIFSAIKETVLKPENMVDFKHLLADLTVVKSNPLLWFFILSLLFYFFYYFYKKILLIKTEVVAAFCLEAMPGRQMAIDSSVSCGRISIDEARVQRKHLMKQVVNAGAVDGFARFHFYEGCVATGLFVFSIAAILLREFFTDDVFFSDAAAMKLADYYYDQILTGEYDGV